MLVLPRDVSLQRSQQAQLSEACKMHSGEPGGAGTKARRRGDLGLCFRHLQRQDWHAHGRLLCQCGREPVLAGSCPGLSAGKMTMVGMYSAGVTYDVTGKGFDPEA